MRSEVRQRGARLALLALAAACLVSLASSVGRGPAPRPQGGASAGVIPGAFDHYDHVNRGWLSLANPEVERDCRGCHDPADPSRGGRLDETCKLCHINPEFSATGRFERVDPKSPFLHGDHTTLSCRECHGPENLGQVSDFLSNEPMPIRRGFAECSRCHGDGAPRYVDPLGTRRDDLAGILQAMINGSPAMGPESLGPFLHIEHMPDPTQSFDMAAVLGADASAPQAGGMGCGSCHQSLTQELVQRGPGLEQVFDDTSCATCHITQGGAAIAFEDGAASESLTLGTFFHADHVRAFEAGRSTNLVAGSAFERLSTQGCNACHAYGVANADGCTNAAAASDFGFEATLPAFEGCAACHSTPAMKPTQHQDWETKCALCHTFPSPREAFADSAPLLEGVPRRRPIGFRIETQEHPMIVADPEAGTRPEACVRCHRAPVTELPSRIREARFDHATHLPSEFSAEDCKDCHGSRIDDASSPAEIGNRLANVRLAQGSGAYGLTYDPDACMRCHKGSQPVPDFDATDSVRAVLFSHRQHLGSRKQDLDCASCHDVPQGAALADPTRYFRTRACSTCHNHTDQPEITGGLGSQSTESCARCHTGSIPAIDASSERPELCGRRRISAIQGTQFHPADRDCTSCHQILEQTLTKLLVSSISTQPDMAVKKAHGARTKEQLRGSCLQCHWSRYMNTMGDDPEDPRVRREQGALSDPYPGVAGSR